VGIMEGWNLHTIKEFGEVFTGTTPSTKKPEYYGGQYKFISPADLDNGKYVSTSHKLITELGLSVSRILPKNAILVGCIGTIGKMGMTTDVKSAFNQQINAIICNKNYDPDFIYYLLTYNRPLLEKTAVKTTLPILNKGNFQEIKLPAPPLPEQRKIAHVLNTVQKAIEQQDKLIRTTTELKKALMQKLFTEGTRGESLKETEIGLVPESWEVKPFSEIFEIIKTQSHSRNKLTFGKTDTKILNIHYGDIHAKFKDNIVDLELDEVPYIIDEHVDENKNNFLKDGDVVIADASEDLIDIGKCIELKNVKNKKIIGGLHTIVARDKNNLIQKGFGAYIFMNKYVSIEIRLIATGLSVYGISKGNLLKMLIPIPPSHEQAEIAETMDRCNKKIFYHQKKKQTLTDLFKTLMHELMTGQRRVHDLDFDKIIKDGIV